MKEQKGIVQINIVFSLISLFLIVSLGSGCGQYAIE